MVFGSGPIFSSRTNLFFWVGELGMLSRITDSYQSHLFRSFGWLLCTSAMSSPWVGRNDSKSRPEKWKIQILDRNEAKGQRETCICCILNLQFHDFVIFRYFSMVLLFYFQDFVPGRCWQIVVMLTLVWHLVQHISVPCCELLPVSWSWWRWLSWRSRSCGTAEWEWPSSWFTVTVDWRWKACHQTPWPCWEGAGEDPMELLLKFWAKFLWTFWLLLKTWRSILMFWILMGLIGISMFLYVFICFYHLSSSFCRGGIPEWQRQVDGLKIHNFHPVPCASAWCCSVVTASRWRPPRCWSCDAQQRNSSNYRYTDSSQRRLDPTGWD